MLIKCKGVHLNFIENLLLPQTWKIGYLSATLGHHNDIIMSTMAFHITSLTIVYSTFDSGGDTCKKNINAPRHWPLCGEFTGDRLMK